MTDLALSRRHAIASMGATAALTASGVSFAAASGAPADLLALDDVVLAWPKYQRLASFGTPLRDGQTVTLRRESHRPFDDEAVAVYSADQDRLGYVERRHVPALSWAMERGDAVEATISRLAPPVRDGRAIGGWGNVRLDIRVKAAAAQV